MPQDTSLSERQQRELDYHRAHSQKFEHCVAEALNEGLLHSRNRRWWNHYWSMYTAFQSMDLAGKRVLIDGCGFGHDVASLAAMGAGSVVGNDLSPESIDIARRRTMQLGLGNVTFDVAPCEKLPYDNAQFDLLVLYDILHHVDIPLALAEARRVLKPDGTVVIGEPYTHSLLQRLIRKNVLVELVIYPLMKRHMYQTDKPYITEDERKLDQRDLGVILSQVQPTRLDYYYFILQRLIPARFETFAKVDRTISRAMGSLGSLLCGRFLLVGKFKAP